MEAFNDNFTYIKGKVLQIDFNLEETPNAKILPQTMEAFLDNFNYAQDEVLQIDVNLNPHCCTFILNSYRC